MPRYYKIYSVRFDDNDSDKLIDRLLLRVETSYKEACDHYERFMLNAGFSEEHVKMIMKDLRRSGKCKTLVRACSRIPNLHGYLGAGGYELIRTEEED